ncbi:hypothetical protein KP781_02435 [Streptococcus equi subsp. zooepidemicus]|uniref:hypothetical protein n=1 Tax=Streptococcus equi TaxID=1336 RepID=UPI0002D5053A|nr:hypothetical protein [Streptococcus equi]MCD3398578.1 hypothetical protein [Streptococcus equi subsp. zooepidemicus]
MTGLREGLVLLGGIGYGLSSHHSYKKTSADSRQLNREQRLFFLGWGEGEELLKLILSDQKSLDH